jgi:hypothetical protein
MLSREEASAVANSWWDSWIAQLQPYAILLRLFIDGVLQAPEFEVLYQVSVSPRPLGSNVGRSGLWLAAMANNGGVRLSWL